MTIEGDSFVDVWHEIQKYPSQGKMSDHFGVPSRPTLARYSTWEVLGYDPWGKPLFRGSKTNMTDMAVLIRLVTGEGSIEDIRDNAASKQALEIETTSVLHEQYPESTQLPKNIVSSPNYAFSAMTAINYTDYDVDPIHAVREHLGKAEYR